MAKRTSKKNNTSRDKRLKAIENARTHYWPQIYNIIEVEDEQGYYSVLSDGTKAIAEQIIEQLEAGNKEGANISYGVIEQMIKSNKELLLDSIVSFEEKEAGLLKPVYKRFTDVLRAIQIQLMASIENRGLDSEDLNVFERLHAESRLQHLQSNNTNNQKFIWKGTPAQLAFILGLLQGKGYIEMTKSGERNARMLLKLFDIPDFDTTPESLGRCFQQLANDILPINPEDAAKFQKIPRREELKR